MASSRDQVVAAGAGTLAAFLWAAYYIFVLALPSRSDLLILVVPFLAGAAAFLLPVPGIGAPGPRGLLSSFSGWGGLLRGALLFGLQVDVIVSTRWAGAVDTSLATLLADVVATPLLVYAFYRTEASRMRAAAFWVGVGIASVGAVLVIVGGGSTSALGLVAGLVLVPLPFLIAFYFVSVNQAVKQASSASVLGAAALMAALLGTLAGLLVEGPGAILVSLSLLQWGLLIALGLTSFYVAPWAYFLAAARTSIVIPAVLMALIPVFTLVLVALLGFQPVARVAWVGVPIAFAGSLLATVEIKLAGRRR